VVLVFLVPTSFFPDASSTVSGLLSDLQNLAWLWAVSVDALVPDSYIIPVATKGPRLTLLWIAYC
jgi:hypothetical protein